MKPKLYILPVIVLLVFSCKKSNPVDQSANKKLSKIESIDGMYTTTTFYSYDTDNKLLRLRQTETGGGSSYESGFRVSRTNGMINQVVFANYRVRDSNTMKVATTGQQYSSIEWSENIGSATLTHKTTFTYDNEGHIEEAATVDYYNSVPDPKNRTTYTYKNNNLATIKVYRTSTGTDVFDHQFDLEYDQKTNPLAFGTEWILLSFLQNDFIEPQSSANNMTKLTYKETGQPDEIFNMNYSYNANGLPASASFKSTDPSQPAQKITYTYE